MIKPKVISILKTITWRAIAIMITIAITLWFTREFNTSIKITTYIHLIKTILYYFHERFWMRYYE